MCSVLSNSEEAAALDVLHFLVFDTQNPEGPAGLDLRHMRHNVRCAAGDEGGTVIIIINQSDDR